MLRKMSRTLPSAEGVRIHETITTMLARGNGKDSVSLDSSSLSSVGKNSDQGEGIAGQ